MFSNRDFVLNRNLWETDVLFEDDQSELLLLEDWTNIARKMIYQSTTINIRFVTRTKKRILLGFSMSKLRLL